MSSFPPQNSRELAGRRRRLFRRAVGLSEPVVKYMDVLPRRSTEPALSKRLASFVIALLAAAVVAELVLPLFPPRLGTMRQIVHHVDSSGNYDLVPSVEVRFSGMFHTISPSVLWQVNDQGLRDDAHVGPRGSRYRIAMPG